MALVGLVIDVISPFLIVGSFVVLLEISVGCSPVR